MEHMIVPINDFVGFYYPPSLPEVSKTYSGGSFRLGLGGRIDARLIPSPHPAPVIYLYDTCEIDIVTGVWEIVIFLRPGSGLERLIRAHFRLVPSKSSSPTDFNPPHIDKIWIIPFHSATLSRQSPNLFDHSSRTTGISPISRHPEQWYLLYLRLARNRFCASAPI